jgi:hypothetical protein
MPHSGQIRTRLDGCVSLNPSILFQKVIFRLRAGNPGGSPDLSGEASALPHDYR